MGSRKGKIRIYSRRDGLGQGEKIGRRGLGKGGAHISWTDRSGDPEREGLRREGGEKHVPRSGKKSDGGPIPKGPVRRGEMPSSEKWGIRRKSDLWSEKRARLVTKLTTRRCKGKRLCGHYRVASSAGERRGRTERSSPGRPMAGIGETRGAGRKL